MRGDLHIHSNFSDGFDSVEDIIQRAKEKKLQIISITDQDTTETYKYIQGLDIKDLIIIPGVEISAYDYYRDRKVHILGYSYQTTEHINSLCVPMLNQRKEKSEKQLQIIKDAGYPIDKNYLYRSINSKNTLYKEQIIYAIVKKPYHTPEYQAVYQELEKNDKLRELSEIKYVDAKDAVQAVVADGGIPILAHPGTYDSFDIIPELITYGLKGVEVYHTNHTMKDVEKAKKICKLYSLIQTAGSDYHGKFNNIMDLESLPLKEETINTLLHRPNKENQEITNN